MTTTSPSRRSVERAPGHYRHDVMLWSDVDDFVERTVRFVRDGLDSGEPVMVAVPRARLLRVEQALGPDADAVVLADMESVGSNPARIIAAWAEFLTAAAGRPARGVGEPLWAGRRDAEVEECQLHESLLNAAVPTDTPFWLRCPYEVGALPVAVIEESLRTHPWVADDHGSSEANPAFVAQSAGHAFAALLSEPPGSHVVRTITSASLRSVRDLALHVARVCGVDESRAADLGLALHELGVNTLVHGGGGGTLRLWRTADALVCEVVDAGVVTDPLTGRFAPDMEEPDGRGLWMVNQLCDLVQLRSSATGTTVRVHTWL
jgi:anti-sigma regulatory factor (Ser/Thr protein kinase)